MKQKKQNLKSLIYPVQTINEWRYEAKLWLFEQTINIPWGYRFYFVATPVKMHSEYKTILLNDIRINNGLPCFERNYQGYNAAHLFCNFIFPFQFDEFSGEYYIFSAIKSHRYDPQRGYRVIDFHDVIAHQKIEVSQNNFIGGHLYV